MQSTGIPTKNRLTSTSPKKMNQGEKAADI